MPTGVYDVIFAVSHSIRNHLIYIKGIFAPEVVLIYGVDYLI